METRGKKFPNCLASTSKSSDTKKHTSVLFLFSHVIVPIDCITSKSDKLDLQVYQHPQDLLKSI